jgi:hypothetical protein
MPKTYVINLIFLKNLSEAYKINDTTQPLNIFKITPIFFWPIFFLKDNGKSYLIFISLFLLRFSKKIFSKK